MDQVIELHLANPNIAFVFTGLQYGAPSPKGETLLRAAFSASPHRTVRAAACYELARFLRFKATAADNLKALREKPTPGDPATRNALESSLSSLERFAGVDVAKTLMEAEQLLERVGREFADVPQAQFELRNLAVGKPAPEIEGRDVDGQLFRLSDYRGKVIVLTFSGNWCGPCRAMYPQERELVSRLKDRPFAMLSVNTDPERETLRKSIREGEITWRCWWDGGRDGPISSRWNILFYPTVFVIDAKGIIRDVGPSGKDINQTVDRLLEKTTKGWAKLRPRSR
jgi:peroxiredoxin